MSQFVKIEDTSSASEARRRVRKIGAIANLDADTVERAAIVATEAATNIARHAGQGNILIDVLPLFGSSLIAIVAMDDGPGIARPEVMMRDGETTANGAGTGLGAMQRLSDQFDIHTGPDKGTVVACVLGKPASNFASRRFDAAGLRLNHPNETVCGDAWVVRKNRRTAQFFLCDGLGHGPRAAAAAEESVDALVAHRGGDVGTVLDDLSRTMHSSRGAVAGLCQIDGESAEMHFGGIGNISMLQVSGGQVRRFASRDGRLGAVDRPPLVETFTVTPGDVMIMHSDGISTLRGIEKRVGLMRRSALTIAGVLMRDNLRGRDDAGVVVMKVRPHGETE